MEPTHFIVSMQAGLTKNSQSKMWRCVTQDGERVNVFQHTDPAKNNARLFEQAGYLADMTALENGQELIWKQFPVGVVMQKNGQWWEVTAVAARPADAQPDPQWMPDLSLYRAKAITWAQQILRPYTAMRFWDTEATSADKDAEIISIAIMDEDLHFRMNRLIKPCDMDRVASSAHIHGITPEKLETAAPFPDVYWEIKDCLAGEIWVIYNSGFDPQILERNCLRHGLEPFVPLGINDAMQLFAEFNGEWDPAWQKFLPKKLSVAAEMLGIQMAEAHDALADVNTMYALIEAVADQDDLKI